MSILQELNQIIKELNQLSFKNSYKWVQNLEANKKEVKTTEQMEALNEIISDCAFVLINPKLLTGKINKLKVSLGGEPVKITPADIEYQRQEKERIAEEARKETEKERLKKLAEEKKEYQKKEQLRKIAKKWQQVFNSNGLTNEELKTKWKNKREYTPEQVDQILKNGWEDPDLIINGKIPSYESSGQVIKNIDPLVRNKKVIDKKHAERKARK